MIQKGFLVIKEVISGRLISLVVFLTVFLSVFLTSVFFTGSENFKNYIQSKFATSIPPDTIRVSTRPGRNFFFFQFAPSGKKIDKSSLWKIRKIKGVDVIYPVMAADFPMQAGISIFGIRYRTDLLAMGVPYSLVKDDIKNMRMKKLWNIKTPGTEIPVLVPENILRAYNEGMAGQNNLPRISSQRARGLNFNLKLGHSSLRSLEGYTEKNAVITGFTEKINSLSLVLPLKTTEYYNKRFGSGKPNYLYLFVKVKDHKSFPLVVESIKKMDLRVESGSHISKRITDLMNMGELVLGSIVYILIAIAGIAIAFSSMISVYNRMEYYRIMRISGASSIFIVFTVILRYLIIGFAGSCLGIFIFEYSGDMFIKNTFMANDIFKGLLPPGIKFRILISGTLLPAIATLPALFRLSTSALNRDW